MASSGYRGRAPSHSGPGSRNGQNNAISSGPRGGAVPVARGGTSASQGSRWGSDPPSTSSPSLNHKNLGINRSSGPANQVRNTQQINNSSSAFPSLGTNTQLDESQKLMKDRMLFLLVTLVGNPVTVTVRGGKQFFGIFSAANTESSELGIALASAQEIIPPNDQAEKPQLGPIKKMLVIHGRDLESIDASEIQIIDQEKEMKEARERDAFRTDTEISKTVDPTNSERTLQKWSDDFNFTQTDNDKATPAWASPTTSGLEDAGSKGQGWDQFAANEARFGIKSDYEETLYTTALDRSAKDFKEREKQADRIAREIMSQLTTNSHLAEERGQMDDSGVNEEDKYGAVVRGPNAYIPPALRNKPAAPKNTTASQSSSSPPPPSSGSAVVKMNGIVKPQQPAQPNTNPSVNPGSNGANTTNPTVTAPQTSFNPTPQAESKSQQAPKPPIVQIKVPSPSLSAQEQDKQDASKNNGTNTSNPLMGDFRQFVSSERERLEKKKAALAKKEKDTRLADLKSWASTFKLKTPMPLDVAGVVPKDRPTDASEKPRDPSLQKSLSPTAAHMAASGIKQTSFSPDPSKLSARPSAGTVSMASSPSTGFSTVAKDKESQKLAETKAMLVKLAIPKIPPYNPERAKARQAAAVPEAAVDSLDKCNKEKPDSGSLTSSASAFKLSAKASSFKPFNPNAAAFTPGGTSASSKKSDSASASPAVVPANPFFGNRVLKKPLASTTLHVRENFNPFKVSKVPDAKSIGHMWAFSGKPFRQHFVMAGPQTHFDDGTGAVYIQTMPVAMPHGAIHPGLQTPQTVPQQQQVHGAQVHPSHMAVAAPPAGPTPAAQQQQPFGIMYQPYGPYRFHGQPQPQGLPQAQQHGMVQPMQMPPNAQGAPLPYAAMPPQFMGQMPFSPPIPHHTAPQALYSPQMGNIPPPGQHGQFIPGAPHSVGPPPGPQGAQAHPNVRPPPPHMQQKGNHAPQMYYQPQPGPMSAMPYPAQFAMQPGPNAVRPSGPPMDVSTAGPGIGVSSNVGLPTAGTITGVPAEGGSH